MHQAELPYYEVAILTRLTGPDERGWSAATAKGILTLAFSPTDRDRMYALAAKARTGALTSEEQAEVEAYSRIGSLLGILKSKARRALRHRTGNGKPKLR
jgi:hypothetical protein